MIYQIPPEMLVNFATGVVAKPEIQKNLVNAMSRGEEMMLKFVSDRLICKEGENKPMQSF